MSRVCIDATFFLGLNSANEPERIATKNFLVEHLDCKLYMSYEQVGICDNLIWSYDHYKQNLYFPFMDYFMAEAKMIRKPYSEQTFQLMEREDTLCFTERLTCAFAREHDCLLYTWNNKIITSQKAPLGNIIKYFRLPESTFPVPIEELYQQALGLRLSIKDLFCQ
jgi:hypothetical protein